jgi:hypothetical protein
MKTEETETPIKTRQKPEYKQFSWWINEKAGRVFIFIGCWFDANYLQANDHYGWRLQFAEQGKEKPVILSLTDWEEQIKKGNIKQFYK